MSLKPIYKVADVKALSIKDIKAKLYKRFVLLATKHNSPETAAPFFLQLNFPYLEEQGLLLLFGKLNAWKPYVKEALKDKNTMRRGYCYVLSDDKGQPTTLVLNTTGGKAKINLTLKQLKAITRKFVIEIGADAEDDPKRDDAFENLPEINEDEADALLDQDEEAEPETKTDEKTEDKTKDKSKDKKSNLDKDLDKGLGEKKKNKPLNFTSDAHRDEIDKLIKKLKKLVPDLEKAKDGKTAYEANLAIEAALTEYQTNSRYKLKF